MLRFRTVVPSPPTNTPEAIELLSDVLPPPDDPKLIVPGESVALLRVGDSRERMLELFPKKPNIDLEYNYDQKCCGCDFSDYHWLPPDFKSNGLFFYLKQGRIYQISVQSDLFATSKGVKLESTPETVRRQYPDANRAYVYLNSSSKFTGWRNIVYWVDGISGVAFEFYYDRKERRRYVGAIIVFDPESEFQPDGCTSSLREFTELAPYTIEPAEWMQKDFEKRHNIKNTSR
jgi:hypothetical protein